MHDPLQRLYKTKITLLAVVMTVAGLALLLLAYWAEHTRSIHWISSLPVTDLGSGIFTTGLVVVAFTYLDG